MDRQIRFIFSVLTVFILGFAMPTGSFAESSFIRDIIVMDIEGSGQNKEDAAKKFYDAAARATLTDLSISPDSAVGQEVITHPLKYGSEYGVEKGKLRDDSFRYFGNMKFSGSRIFEFVSAQVRNAVGKTTNSKIFVACFVHSSDKSFPTDMYETIAMQLNTKVEKELTELRFQIGENKQLKDLLYTLSKNGPGSSQMDIDQSIDNLLRDAGLQGKSILLENPSVKYVFVAFVDVYKIRKNDRTGWLKGEATISGSLKKIKGGELEPLVTVSEPSGMIAAKDSEKLSVQIIASAGRIIVLHSILDNLLKKWSEKSVNELKVAICYDKSDFGWAGKVTRQLQNAGSKFDRTAGRYATPKVGKIERYVLVSNNITNKFELAEYLNKYDMKFEFDEIGDYLVIAPNKDFDCLTDEKLFKKQTF
ncbi:MAG: hypothetical protein EPN22_01510 [Nitrospirae bacterium]|nr:MAG: hypothetical protein EPN22_01510 [Nitrospirota bacterium]